jgi:hypothetical protein
MINERRNFYRLLNVQPDATLSVITSCHRVLMQKLHRCVDQDYANTRAHILNTALIVLQDPLKRSTYDRRLRKQYSIRKLSLGSFASKPATHALGQEGKIASGNRRNYYRILQIQPDAPTAAIIASYTALADYPLQNQDLLSEAFAVLANPAIRLRYDDFLAGRIHPRPEQSPSASQYGALIRRINVSTSKHPCTQSETTAALYHCVFCHTPFVYKLTLYPSASCLECGSPLPIATIIDQSGLCSQNHRACERTSAAGALAFYLCWPDTPRHGVLQDLSPKGMGFLTRSPLGVGNVIKIETPHFSAIAEVMRIQQAKDDYVSAGARFLTVKFTQERGNFLVAQA